MVRIYEVPGIRDIYDNSAVFRIIGKERTSDGNQTFNLTFHLTLFYLETRYS